ncbi:hypothetical protein EVAR_32485_1 [Eumeta japonica]|uniref:Uncharacterized protein n=1 Tax=Eumeta variegata TaxID=151549 RepID=A0A4C1VLT5_EUMVA|nr:hypothetical protein EVAR_32485_1 [Eumeta japonica]
MSLNGDDRRKYIDAVRFMIQTDKRVTYQQICTSLGIVASENGFLAVWGKGVCGQNHGQRFDDQTSLLQHELRMWRSECNCDGCIFFPLAARRRLKMHTHTRVPVRAGVWG